jgi:HPt (histidine-containing phosphotransfer) domain-containing protein
MDDYLAKPVAPEQIEAMLRKWTRGPDAGRGAVAGQPSDGGSGAGPLDWDVLSDLMAVTRAEFMRDLLALFVRDSRAALADLQGARLRGDLPAWRAVSHKLRGSCATVGARGMMRITTRMEGLAEADLGSQGERLLGDLEEEFARVQSELKAEQHRAGAPFPL